MRRDRYRRPEPVGDEMILVSARTAEVVARVPQNPPTGGYPKMARFKGTGKAPGGQLAEGSIVDIPDDSDRAQEVVEKGWATKVEGADDPGRDRISVAQAIVRNDPISHPEDIKVAQEIGADAHAIVHLQDPDATQKDLDALEKTHQEGRLAPGEGFGNPDTGLSASTKSSGSTTKSESSKS
jgi:hypothetical protein